MEASGQAILQEAGVRKEDIQFIRSMDMRYLGQGFEIKVPIPSGKLRARHRQQIESNFYEAYLKLYNRYSTDIPIEIVNCRVVSSGPVPSIDLSVEAEKRDLGNAVKGKRRIYLPEKSDFEECKVYDHYRLFPGAVFKGPVIVEQRESTVVVGSDSVTVDQYLNLLIDVV